MVLTVIRGDSQGCKSKEGEFQKPGILLGKEWKPQKQGGHIKSGSRKGTVWATQPPPCCVTSGKSLTLSGPQLEIKRPALPRPHRTAVKITQVKNAVWT